MISINKVEILGNITKEPELKYTKSNMAICKVGVASNHSWKNQAGEWQEKATFVDVTFWGKTAERVAQLRKGEKIFIDGRLENNEWTTPQGEKRSALGVTGRDFFAGANAVKAPLSPDEIEGEKIATEVDKALSPKVDVKAPEEDEVPPEDGNEPIPF